MLCGAFFPPLTAIISAVLTADADQAFERCNDKLTRASWDIIEKGFVQRRPPGPDRTGAAARHDAKSVLVRRGKLNIVKSGGPAYGPAWYSITVQVVATALFVFTQLS